MKRTSLLLLLFALLFCVAFTACKPQEEVPVVEEPQVELPEPEPEPLPYDGPENPLTGLPVDEDISANRPFAISINNLKQAQPQHGVSQADIIYEVLAEGGITRMVAIYQDSADVGIIGSIRSARPYFLDLVQGHDAIFIHAGGSEDAYAAIRNRNVQNVDGVRGNGAMFYRDSERRRANGYEHSLMTSSELIAEKIGSYGFRMEHESGYAYRVAFAEEDSLLGGEAASDIRVTFSNYKTGEFLYDAETALYAVGQYGGAYVDGNTSEQVQAKNVLVLFAATKTLDNEGRLSVTLTGSGTGYCARDGQYVPITWQKPDADSQFTYKLENGSALELARGMSYVCIVPLNAAVSFS